MKLLPDAMHEIRECYNKWVQPMNNIKYQTYRQKNLKLEKMLEWLKQVEDNSAQMRKLLESLNYAHP